jgi:hypothetical protein
MRAHSNARVPPHRNLLASLAPNRRRKSAETLVVKAPDAACRRSPSLARNNEQEVYPWRVLWHNGCMLDGHAGCDPPAEASFELRPSLEAVALAEDPPFGGLWCDQPAPFLGPAAQLS